MFRVLHTCQEKSLQYPSIKTANIITRFYQYSSRLQQDKDLPVFLKVKTKWNFTNIHQGYHKMKFYAYCSRLQQDEILPVFLKITDSQFSLNKMKISTLCTKGTASQLFPHKRKKYQYYAPREQLLSSFPTRENINIMHQGNSFSAFSPQEKTSILCTKGTASQLFPNKRKHQYYPPREQLLSFFPTKISYFNYNTAFYWSRRGHQLIL